MAQPTDNEVLPLSGAGIRASRDLLHAASDAVGAELDAIVAEVSSGMDALGIVADGAPIAIIATRAGGDGVVIEYLAVAEAMRGHGLAGRLVEAVRRARPGSAIIAETADDAVGFYRAAGFVVAAAPEDPRWPGSARWRCVLPGS